MKSFLIGPINFINDIIFFIAGFVAGVVTFILMD